MIRFLKGIIIPIIGGIFLGLGIATLLLWQNGLFNLNKEDIQVSQTTTPLLSPLTTPTITPQKESKVLAETTTKPLNEISGFLPYWELKSAQIPMSKMKTIYFFGIPIDKSGKVNKLDDQGNENPGWTQFKSKEFDDLIALAHKNNVKVSLVLEIMNNDDIVAVINNPLARENTRENILSLIKQKNLDGINIDIEYQGVPDSPAIKNFTTFITEFRDFTNQSHEHIDLTLDVHADSVVKTRLFELEKIYPSLDQIIIMGYDFYRPTSSVSGPIAPLNGKEKFEYDITTTLQDFLKIVPNNKLILGLPFYGYEWETETASPFSKTIPDTGALATYGRIQKIINEQHIIPKWDNLSESPYLVFEDKGILHQIFYENSLSLGKKIDLVKKSDLAGIAIWALGYDGDYPDIWQTIK